MSIATLAAKPAFLIQYDPHSAAELAASWHAGNDFEYPAVDRNLDAVSADDLVFFWVTGSRDKAGIVGVGIASGIVEQLDHPRNYQQPEGPRSLRDSAEVALAWVGDRPVITRDELKQDAAFADFELFVMPNRPNAFAVSAEQSAVILGRLNEVLG